jgi:predicted DNA-binding antitoxin AbrB/MazE fold protein
MTVKRGKVPSSADSLRGGDEMSSTKAYRQVRAVHHGGVLKLLDTLDLPEGAQVRLSIQSVLPAGAELVYPTRLVSADRLDVLTGLVEVGGNALADSEALYDVDRT